MNDRTCPHCKTAMVDELEADADNLAQLETEDEVGSPICLSCLLRRWETTYWQHEGSEVVFTASPTGSWSKNDLETLSPDVDEIFQETFFSRIKDGWKYVIQYPTEINV